MWFLCCGHNSKPHELSSFLMEVSCHYLIFCFWSVSTSERLGAPVTSEDLKCPHLPATPGWAAAELAYEVLGLQKSTGTARIQSSLHRFFASSLIIPELFWRNKPCSTETHAIAGGLILNKHVLKPHSREPPLQRQHGVEPWLPPPPRARGRTGGPRWLIAREWAACPPAGLSPPKAGASPALPGRRAACLMVVEPLRSLQGSSLNEGEIYRISQLL